MGVPCIVQVVGPTSSGKTTLIVRVVRRLSDTGVRVGVVKHTHHDIDTPNKDSWKFLEEAGARYSVVVKGDGEKVAVFTGGLTFSDVLGELSPRVDVIVVEGFKHLSLGGLRVDLSTTGLSDAEASIIEFVEKCLAGGRRL
ncbi:molybdopterin-guanine dinucleotide biosynthesis protein B [Aeropyrum camini]|uniref:Molybdopterin-guanine dinucleotide biosynthesis protein n=1 Tax=Aeropyrum camini SY1 = JCM 12091 TaxID=1198449 RepID=U3T7X5_9CREN|nr:molybdopterin-guanine dinucleotide biosynthesis protein B [Aeropyrum camini]BAN89607.1 molybdopterin-guanine dinucleotide biosynthesis protein [Aeropyrum camini SY1 = JCM 12091]